MLTRSQDYAIKAYEKVIDIKNKEPETKAKSYGVMAHKLPILIHTGGLAQALAFVQSRGKGLQPQLLEDLAYTIGLKSREELLEQARTATLNEYILLTRKVLAALLWYKRFAQSELHVELGDEVDEQLEVNHG
jgi:CRISPR-associated protein Cmr5